MQRALDLLRGAKRKAEQQLTPAAEKLASHPLGGLDAAGDECAVHDAADCAPLDAAAAPAIEPPQPAQQAAAGSLPPAAAEAQPPAVVLPVTSSGEWQGARSGGRQSSGSEAVAVGAPAAPRPGSAGKAAGAAPAPRPGSAGSSGKAAGGPTAPRPGSAGGGSGSGGSRSASERPPLSAEDLAAVAAASDRRSAYRPRGVYITDLTAAEWCTVRIGCVFTCGGS